MVASRPKVFLLSLVALFGLLGSSPCFASKGNCRKALKYLGKEVFISVFRPYFTIVDAGKYFGDQLSLIKFRAMLPEESSQKHPAGNTSSKREDQEVREKIESLTQKGGFKERVLLKNRLASLLYLASLGSLTLIPDDIMTMDELYDASESLLNPEEDFLYTNLFSPDDRTLFDFFEARYSEVKTPHSEYWEVKNFQHLFEKLAKRLKERGKGYSHIEWNGHTVDYRGTGRGISIREDRLSSDEILALLFIRDYYFKSGNFPKAGIEAFNSKRKYPINPTDFKTVCDIGITNGLLSTSRAASCELGSPKDEGQLRNLFTSLLHPKGGTSISSPKNNGIRSRLKRSLNGSLVALSPTHFWYSYQKIKVYLQYLNPLKAVKDTLEVKPVVVKVKPNEGQFYNPK